MYAFPLPIPRPRSTHSSDEGTSRARGRARADEAVEAARRLLAERREQLLRDRARPTAMMP